MQGAIRSNIEDTNNIASWKAQLNIFGEEDEAARICAFRGVRGGTGRYCIRARVRPHVGDTRDKSAQEKELGGGECRLSRVDRRRLLAADYSPRWHESAHCNMSP
jgi:hypothetical protein